MLHDMSLIFSYNLRQYISLIYSIKIYHNRHYTCFPLYCWTALKSWFLKLELFDDT